MKRLLLLLTVQSMAGWTLGNSVELNLFNEIAGVKFTGGINNAYEGTVSYAHSQYDNRDSNLTTAGFLAIGVRDKLTGKVGLQTFWLNGSGHDTYGLAIGGGAKYLITPELWTSGELFYAPDIIVGGDFKNYYNFDARIGYNVLSQAAVSLSYHNYGANNGDNNVEMYNGLQLNLTFHL